MSVYQGKVSQKREIVGNCCKARQPGIQESRKIQNTQASQVELEKAGESS